MTSTHFDDIRSVKVIPVPGAGAIVMLQIGVKERISLALRTEEQARVVARAINADAETMGKAAARLLAGMDNPKNKTGGA